MGDNFYKECPAMMSDGRLYADHRSATRREEFIKSQLGIINDHDYRKYLQTHGSDIMDHEWNYYRKFQSCFPNSCIHHYGTRTTPMANDVEFKTYNGVRSGKLPPPSCYKFDDYRINGGK